MINLVNKMDNVNVLNTIERKIFLHITEKMNGKMEGMASISTSPECNKQCEKNAKVKGSVCQKCFAKSMMKRYSNLQLALQRNYELMQFIIELDDLPRFNNRYVRLEAFGDLGSTEQFINYVNICNVNPHVNFAIWTKNPHIIAKVLNEMGYKKPKNLQIVVSSLFLNKPIDYDKLSHDRKWFIDKIFTVYTKDHALKNNININCGNAKCMSCLKCYTKNNIIYINEIVKSQQKAYYEALSILKDYKFFIDESEMDHTQETIDLYISSMFYDLYNNYEGKDQSHEACIKWIRKQEKKMENTIKKYYK